jgi:hypothetical protein
MSTVLTGQVDLTSTAQQLDTSQATASCVVFTIRAPYSNTNPAFIGGSDLTTETGHQLDPGNSVVYERQVQNGSTLYQGRLSDFYVAGTTGDTVTWLALG